MPLLLLGLVACLAGCPQYGIMDDGTSVSYGWGNRGRLVNPTRLPRAGEGYWIPPRWAARGLNFGTDEIVRLIAYAGRQVSREYPGSRIGVADISPERGGPSRWHSTHQSGLDVDLLFFELDSSGRPASSDAMLHYRGDGVARSATGRNFDVERNWFLVKSLIQNPIARLQFIFIYDPLKQMLLDYAMAIGEPPDIVEEASYLLHQPSDSASHDDHFHVRLYCSKADRDLGCRDRGLLRWTKKDRKYRDHPRRETAPVAARVLLSRPLPALLSLTALPFRTPPK